ncbi:hypothetical protein MMC12_005406 [Toensbergia leucococca]|nr:hypothetical protein [Toensbergia leucococca]
MSLSPSASASPPSSPSTISQQMGFASFGSQPRPKSKSKGKRKREEVSGSGSNMMPLGLRRAPGGNGEIVRRGSGEGVAGKEAEATRVVGGEEEKQQMRHRLPARLPQPTNDKSPPPLPNLTHHQPPLPALPPKHPPHTTTPLPLSETTPEHDWAALRRGMRVPSGDIAYFDWGFVGDPWRDLVDRGG